jgi:phage FluMu gp28-like protein
MAVILKGLHNRQKEIANEILRSKAKYHSVNASRQSGKTVLITKLAMLLGLTVSDEQILIVSPSYEQVDNVYDRIISTKGSDQIIVKKKDSKPKSITLQTNTILKFKSADRPDFIRGGSYKYVICDEFAFFKDGVFSTVIRPTTAAKSDSKIIVVSTPKGKGNEFYQMSESAVSNPERYKYYEMHYTDNPYYDLEEVNDARARLPKNIFLQEYEAKFIDSGGDVFENIDDVAILEEYPLFDSNERYFSAIDWGRANDSTVLTILNKSCQVVNIIEVKGDWGTQINSIANVLNVYKPIVYAESNGIGDPLIVALREKYSNIREFTMTNNSKREIIEDLKMKIYMNNIALPTYNRCSKLHLEMSDYTYSMTQTGLITYHHKSGSHDDFVDSLAIANYCYNKHNVGFDTSRVKLAKRSSFYN